ncbi:glycerol-3-phosphate dehydrogenase (NAD(+)) [Acetobacter pasteurianus]|uniref:Glycerol-3-phosphate dehydrogenase [NAD(+)] n=1 Tax=Lodderomyces elongisporus (strain ATCC 11503 / CBS 2605 / JCM 1781 / NBRC 1676 / NRRL YB-4239) TaxID=379508 RepID=A5DYF2_LODEL|nr:glycerol-3-phosphate dehydrogenase [Lodderomyces elongisporus]EDK44210.1 glycerol-3-phosphate dehydrogenase [Lodderomyces elongisporus NRRL YB-4239]MDC6271957.1 glycerol-3-phosphate dehydrogenase (NAD(+)) [Acetobacter pasteurianus]WLF79478.1 glycerol-3-phosphate dehydrogenase [Lodderomyces elongisporus]
MSGAQSRLTQLSNILTPTKSPNPKNSLSPDHPFRICVIGSGNWGTTIAKVVAENALARPHLFAHHVRMWVFEEKIDGKPLTEIINQQHVNIKYLPGVKLPTNLVAEPSLLKTVEGADLIVFNMPHQFLPKILKQLKGHVPPTARAISCLKGLEVSKEGCKLLSTYITEELGITCGALSGANLAPEVARCKWSETTVAYKLPSDYRGAGKDIDQYILKAAFHRPYFHVNVIEDVAGVCIGGALKNIVALAVGFVEGLGWGDNAKAAIMRVGLLETIKFSEMFFPESLASTFTAESAGVADLITTCSGGRNVRVGRYMAETGASAEQAEKKLLNGQSSQGIVTAKEVHELLTNVEKLDEFPLFEATYQIIYGSESIENLPNLLNRDAHFS